MDAGRRMSGLMDSRKSERKAAYDIVKHESIIKGAVSYVYGWGRSIRVPFRKY